MFIIDEINFPGLILDGILGGGGTFAIFGSRMILNNVNSKQCAWIIDIGSDCPDEILDELRLWNTGGIFRFDNSRKCTRGWNGYGENEFRQFKYLTPKKRITMTDLDNYTWMLKSKSFHFICSPRRCIELLRELDDLSMKNNVCTSNAIIAWEPIPDCCTPEFLQDTLNILNQIDILTPNAAECASFFEESEPRDKENCERVASKFYNYMTKPDSGIVLRCGSLGSCLLKSGIKEVKWFPAYHKKNDDMTKNKVVDPTGCGNTFVGAFTTEFVKSNKNFELSSIYATLASGACIEQYGLPELTISDNGEDLWNGVSLNQRLEKYLDDYPEFKKYF
jgi:sugar/nucleoside kinase (ribokinase family)